jgi:hypothetical protein
MHALLQPLPPALLSATPQVNAPYIDVEDRSRHLHTMEQLAEEMHCPLQEITPLYENTLAQLRQRAQIHDFLPILVAKGVKNALRSKPGAH